MIKYYIGELQLQRIKLRNPETGFWQKNVINAIKCQDLMTSFSWHFKQNIIKHAH